MCVIQASLGTVTVWCWCTCAGRNSKHTLPLACALLNQKGVEWLLGCVPPGSMPCVVLPTCPKSSTLFASVAQPGSSAAASKLYLRACKDDDLMVLGAVVCVAAGEWLIQGHAVQAADQTWHRHSQGVGRRRSKTSRRMHRRSFLQLHACG